MKSLDCTDFLFTHEGMSTAGGRCDKDGMCAPVTGEMGRLLMAAVDVDASDVTVGDYATLVVLLIAVRPPSLMLNCHCNVINRKITTYITVIMVLTLRESVYNMV